MLFCLEVFLQMFIIKSRHKSCLIGRRIGPTGHHWTAVFTKLLNEQQAFVVVFCKGDQTFVSPGHVVVCSFDCCSDRVSLLTMIRRKKERKKAGISS